MDQQQNCKGQKGYKKRAM